MKPQDRTAAIMRSRLAPAHRLLLIAVSSFMYDDQLAAWPSPETLADLTGFAVSKVKGDLAELVRQEVITRSDEGRRTKVTRISWDRLATYVPAPSALARRRQPSAGRTEPSSGRTLPSAGRTEPSADAPFNRPPGGPDPEKTRPIEMHSEIGVVSDDPLSAAPPAPPPPAQRPDAVSQPSEGGTPAPTPPRSPAPAPPRAPRPPRAPPTPKPRSAPGYAEAIALWDACFVEAFPADDGLVRYPWIFAGRAHDGQRVKLWLDAVQVGPNADEDRVTQGLGALEAAFRAYFARVAVGSAWPVGEPATTRVFTDQLARWLQTSPTEATGPPGRANRPKSSADRRRETVALLDQALDRMRAPHAQ